jgi:hypothetical protein
MTHLHLVKCESVDLYDCLSRANAREPSFSEVRYIVIGCYAAAIVGTVLGYLS